VAPTFRAPRDITFSVQRGQTLGLIGRNGSGKGTLLIRFAELEAVIDEPVKTYSRGMYMRLGLSVAVQEAAGAVAAARRLEEKGYRPKQRAPTARGAASRDRVRQNARSRRSGAACVPEWLAGAGGPPL
jgi:ABC-type glutathione transport system ATPase component